MLRNASEPSNLSDCDDTDMRLFTLNSYHFWICNPEKVRVAEVVLASDPFDSDCDPGLSVACRCTWLMVKTGISSGALFGENPLDGGIWMSWEVNRWEHGHPGLLASIWHSDDGLGDCLIGLLVSVKGSVARYASLPTQVPTPVSVTMWCLSPHLRSGLLPMTISHKRGQPNWGPSLLALVRPVLPWQSMSSTTGTIQVWGGGGVAHVTSVSVMCIPRKCLVLGQPGDGLLARDQDGKWEGALPNAPTYFRVLSWPLDGMGVWPSVWRLAPDVQSSKSLDFVAIGTWQ